MERKQAHRAMH